jgi:beta-lactam-binding protein with PASTA domain
VSAGEAAQETETREPGEGEVRVPSLAGLTARAVIRTLDEAGLVAHLDGSGVVSAQVPAPGELAARGSFVRVVLSRPSTVEDEVLATDDSPDEPEAASPEAPRADAAPAARPRAAAGLAPAPPARRAREVRAAAPALRASPARRR